MSNNQVPPTQAQLNQMRMAAAQQQLQNGQRANGMNGQAPAQGISNGVPNGGLPLGFNLQNLPQLVQMFKEGKLNPAQVAQLSVFLKQYKQPGQNPNGQQQQPPQQGGNMNVAETSNPNPGPNQANGTPVRPKLPTPAQAIQQLASMSEAQRQQAFQKSPQVAQLWQAHLKGFQAQAGAGVAAAGGSTSQAGLNMPQTRGRPAPNPAVVAAAANGSANNSGRASPAGGAQMNPAAVLAKQQLQQQQRAGTSPAPNGENNGSQQLQQQPHPTRSSTSSLSSPGLSIPANQTAAAPHPNQNGPRPTLSSGLSAGTMLGTPGLVARGSQQGWEEARGLVAARKGLVEGGSGGGAGEIAREEGRKRKIREVVETVQKDEKLDYSVEDMLLELVDEFIEVSTHMAARLAKHRKSSTLDVKDLQLHFERNHNIRIPGFASDELRSAQAGSRRQNNFSLHTQRLQAIQQAKVAAAAAAANSNNAMVKG